MVHLSQCNANVNQMASHTWKSATNAHNIDAITYIAETARECWEPIWPGWKAAMRHPAPNAGVPSKDTCIATSFALREILRRCIPTWNWHVVGGRPTSRTPYGGVWMVDGRGGPEGRQYKKRLTVDITADQFGGPEVFVFDGIPDYYIANASRPLLKRYEENERDTVNLWVGALVCALQEHAKVS
ncbi:unnamed protein product [Sphagnum tenellum]